MNHDIKLFRNQQSAEISGYYTRKKLKELGLKPVINDYHYLEKQWIYNGRAIIRQIPVFSALVHTNNKSINNQSQTNQIHNPPYDTPFLKNRKTTVNNYNPEKNKPTELQLTVPERWWHGLQFPKHLPKSFPIK